jgi:hypothetical protein
MKINRICLVAGALLLAPASFAVNVPVPIEGATINLGLAIQSQMLFTEHGTPSGDGWATDVFARRTRVQFGGTVNQHFSFYTQVDNANFGKYGNYTGRMIVQDAFFSWAPVTNSGDSVFMIEGGIIYAPFARLELTSIATTFTVEGHPDTFRGFSTTFYSANRSTGVGIRGWTLGKHLGYRAAIVEGATPTAADPGLNPKRYPGFGGYVNFDFLAPEEGGFLYNSIYFAKDPILSLGLGGFYQAQALRVTKGVTDQKIASATLFLDFPLSEQQELILIVAGYLEGNGTGSKDTGMAASADLGFRFSFVRPYVAWEMFTATDCPTSASDLTGAALATCLGSGGAHSADSRNFRAGLDFYLNKTQNHVQVEFSVNHGQSSWGPQSITAANAGYVPLSQDPLTAAGPRRAINTSLTAAAQRSVLLHWNAYF